jgi:hypothetical protein
VIEGLLFGERMRKGGEVEPTRGGDELWLIAIYLDGPVVEAAEGFALWSHEKGMMRERGEGGGGRTSLGPHWDRHSMNWTG